MNEDGNMNITADTANKASELRPDIDLNDPKLGLKIAAERLSIVRYVFLVQIEDGIASAAQRASLEYADAVLIGWPETDSPEVADLDDAQLKIVREHMELMEGYIGKYSQMEHDGDLDGMTDTLIRITERVAEVSILFLLLISSCQLHKAAMPSDELSSQPARYDVGTSKKYL